MPTIRKGVTLTDALTSAAAVAPVQRAMIFCFELRHPSLSEPFRFCADKRPFTATLESDAPVDPGATVVHMPLPMTLAHVEESADNAAPEWVTQLSNVSGILAQALRAGRGSLDPWFITERLYASDEPSGPARLPTTTYQMNKADIAALQAQVSAGYSEPANIAYPSLTFKREQYVGLT